MKRLSPCFFFLLVFLSSNSGFGQDATYIKGVLLDSESRGPVVFATVRIKGKALGVISNQDGGFLVPVELITKGTVLQISSMGYQTKEVPISVLTRNGINKILMNVAVERLNEAVVTGKRKRLTAKKIIRYALDRIPDNYPFKEFEVIGYYRDYQLRDNSYTNLNEAIVKVFDDGFQSDDYTQTKYGLYSYRKNTDFPIDSFAAKPYDYRTWDKFIPDASLISDYGGNELVILHIHDAIRNHKVPSYSFVNKMVDDFIKEHRFSSVKHTSYNGEPVYQIDLKKGVFTFKVAGSIYIDKNDYAIRKLTYGVFKKQWNVTTGRHEGPYGLLYEILVEYANVDDAMYLNYISFHNKFKLRRPPIFRIEKVVLDLANDRLQLSLNRPAGNPDELKPFDVRLRYGLDILRFKKMKWTDSDKLMFELSSTEKLAALKMQLDRTKDRELEGERWSFDIKGLTDVEGNKLGERIEEELDQFREFFTQKVIPVPAKRPSQNELMRKDRPLNDTAQPFLKRDGEESRYWQNSPLKTVRN